MRSTVHADTHVERIPHRRKLGTEEIFGSAFREERKRAGLFQEQVAERSQVVVGLITSLEKGERRSREMTLGQLEKITEIFGRRLILEPLPDHATEAVTLGMLFYHARKERKALTPRFIDP